MGYLSVSLLFSSSSAFPSILVSFCPRSELQLWYLAHRMDFREEMQPSQNKLHHQLLAGGKTLCTNNLLMVCKLRAEFAPSYMLHLSLPFFSLTSQKCIEGPFCPSSSVFKKSCKESRLSNYWIYEAERVSSAHVNCPNICIWVSQWEKSPTLLQPNSNFI